MPLIGDFHFNGHKLLTEHPACAQALAKYRINPGNVGKGAKRDTQFATPIDLAVAHDKPRRIDLHWGAPSPAFTPICEGTLRDVSVVDILPCEAGAFYVMDRGYLDYARLYAMHQTGAFFVTRAKHGMDARRVYSSPTQRDSGMICDQRVMLNGFYSAKAYPEHLRRIRFLDASLYTCLQILSVSVFEKTEISRALQPDRSTPELPVTSSQLILFDI